MKLGIHAFLARLTSRSRLDQIEQEALLGLPTQEVHVDANTDFVRLGETVDHVSVVVDGMVARFGQNAEGERQITAIHLPGDAPDLHLVVTPGDSSPIQTLSKATILRIPHAALRSVAAHYPAIAESFWRHCAIDAATTARWVVNLGRRDAKTRMAHLLCEMAVRSDADLSKGAVEFSFPLTQYHLADATGLTSVHVNRTVKSLAAANLVKLTERRAIIPDWDKLVEHGEFEASYLQVGFQSPQRLRLVD